MKRLTAVVCAALALSAAAIAVETKQSNENAAKAAADTITVKGEVLDMACYLDHGAQGAKHAECAKTCITSGLPVGIKAADSGKTYLVVGQHSPLNQQLAAYAGQTITLKGKETSKDGINLLENAEIVK